MEKPTSVNYHRRVVPSRLALVLFALAVACATPTFAPPAHLAVEPATASLAPVVVKEPPSFDAGNAVESAERAAPTPHLNVEALLDQMSVEQKVGQLMMVGFAGTEITASVEALVRDQQVGGVCLFKRNIASAEQVARLNDGLRALLADSIPPFLAVDQEGGNVVRIQDHVVVLPGNMALGATRSESLAYEAGRAQAEALRLLGFNMNFAPVLDVNSNPRNPVIGIRSFGDDPALVARFGEQFIRGQQEANLATVAKHFPGHGSTDADSHRALPVLPDSLPRVMAQLEPFSRAIHAGLDGLMTAHVAVPALTGDDRPSTLAPEVLTGLLREKLGFQGVVLTDELEMEAIAHRFGVGNAAVQSIAAGADMVLIPWRAEAKAEVRRALIAAARSGELPAKRLDSAVRHVLELKIRRGLFDAPAPLDERLARLRALHSDVDQRIARGAVTLLRAARAALPLRPSQRIAVLTADEALGQAVLARAARAELLTVPAYATAARRAEARKRARELALRADVVVVGLINSRQLELVTMAAAAGKPVIAVTMGLPYLAELVPEAKAVLAVYSYRPSAAIAAAAAIFGAEDTPGQLPVALQHFPFGFSLKLKPEPRLPSVAAQAP